MKQYADIEAMAKQAEVQRLHAMDLRLLGAIDYDTLCSRVGFANGVEAALLWVMGNINEIGFPPIQLRQPTDISDENLDNLPGLKKEV